MKTRGYLVILLILFFCQLQAQTNPIVISFTPSHNALNVIQNADITVTFNVDINPETLTNNTVRINGSLSGLHSSTFSYNSNTYTATIMPDSSFKIGEVVTVILTRGIKGANSDSMANSYSWNFTIKTNSSSGLFYNSSTVGVGNTPWYMAAGDFNGDGYIDLATANNHDNSVSILKNDRNGLFTLISTISVGNYPGSIIAADLNNDGYIDLAVTNSGSGTMSLLKNNGNESFTRSDIECHGTNPWNVVALDADGDGDLDLVVANYSSNNISILKNDGNGAFVYSSSVNVAVNPFSLAILDLEGNGVMDLAVANYTSNSISLLKNNGNGFFSQMSSINVGNGPVSILAVNIDGDNAVDLVISNNKGYTLSILKNNGMGEFSTMSTDTIGTHPVFSTATDIDGDGIIDLAVPGIESITILKNNGTGVFVTKSVLNVSKGGIIRMVVAADWNNDGQIDFAGVDQITNSVSIFKACPQKALIRLSSNSLNFGVTANGINKNLYLKIYNDGTDSSLVVTNVVSSNSVFTVDKSSLTIAPLNFDSILVTFSPPSSNITYNYIDSLIITSNDSINPVIKVSIKAVPIRIWDVPSDYGKQVYIKWLTVGSPTAYGMTYFGIYRFDASLWTFLTEIPVLTDSIYQVIVPTLNDSSGTNNKYWSVFRVIAFTSDPSIYTIIGPDSGYSINNWGTGVEQNNSLVPETFVLSQNYPNPFNPSTTIQYALSKDTKVIIKVFNILGQQVKELVNKFQTAGNYDVVFDTSSLSSGIYFYQMKAGTFVETKKMILMK